MNALLQTQIKAAPTPSFTPTRAGFLQRACACGQHSGNGGECAACRQKRLGLQRKAASQTTPGVAPPIVHDVLRSSGQPLDASARAFMEPRFGHDFSQVRVHTDVQAAESARAVNAVAYAVGRNVVFGAGQYNPATTAGRWILAHELTHVVQQGGQHVAAGVALESGRSDTYEQQADTVASAVGRDLSRAPASALSSRVAPKLMLLTPDQFRAQLGTTPEQKSAIDVLFSNATFLALWNYLDACTAVPTQDRGPLALLVTPGLGLPQVERFGGYSPGSRTLEINPTKSEHKSNPTELVDTIVHEVIHTVDHLQSICVAAGAPPAPLAGAATASAPSRAAVAGTPDEARLMIEQGPGASNPCEEFVDINAAAQQMIIQILVENIKVSRVGRPTLVFVNEILRRDPAAMAAYEACRGAACAKPTAAKRRRDIARCSAEIIGRFMPPDLLPSLLPNRVYFDFGANTLRSDSLETLDLIALFLMAHPTISVGLEGHADPVGTAAANLSLGQRRAEIVKQELLRKGVKPAQIRSVSSRGEQDQLSTGPATHWKDRRVEIIPSSVSPGP